MSKSDFNGKTFPIIINGSNVVSSSYNNQFRYSPPVGSFTFPKGSKISIGEISIYYSWFNFNNAYNNNSFSLIFPTYGTLQINIGNQNLSISQLNSYMQQQMINAGLYLVNSSGQNVYYAEILTAPSYYGIQVNLFQIPNSLPSGWSNPGAMPLSGYCPQFVVPNTNFQYVIGFAPATYGSASSTTTESYLSTFTPQVSPVQSILVGCSLLKNLANVNPTILYTFSPAGVSYGNIIQTSPNYPQWIDIYDGVYPYIDIFFYDQNGNPLPLVDTNLVIQLLIYLPD